jgi:enoyl-CoA hydratase/carnithine racemase
MEETNRKQSLSDYFELKITPQGCGEITPLDSIATNGICDIALRELLGIVRSMQEDSRVAVIYFRSQNPKCFCIGANLSKLTQLANREVEQFSRDGIDLMLGLITSEKPVLCSINGICYGGGLEIALSCHVIVCTHRSVFSFPEYGIGLVPGWGGECLLIQRSPQHCVTRLCLLGTKVTAKSALHFGMVDFVVDPKDLGNWSNDVAVRLAHSNTLQHTPTHSNTLQHTPTHSKGVEDANGKSKVRT